ncbi:MAG: hypothetical protein ABIK31_07135 [candidate division WOR-3 bacterium]
MRETKGFRKKNWREWPIVANNTIIKIEAGKNQNSTLDTLKKNSERAFGVSIDDLMA